MGARWVGYVRVSTREQEAGFSLEAQEEAIYNAAAQRGAVVIALFKEIDSGTKTDRAQLHQAVQTTLAIGDALVVWRLDRLARSVRQTLDIVETLQRHHKTLISLTENIDLHSTAGKAMLAILSAFAQFERDSIVERVILGMEAAARNGYWTGGKAPLGYKVVNKRLLVDEEGARIVRYIFERYARGDISVKKLAEELGFSARKVNLILRNEIYVGSRPVKVCYRDETGKFKRPLRYKPPTVFYVPAPQIIDRELFEKVQSILDGFANGPHRSQKHWIVDICYCAKCNTPLKGIGGRKNRRERYQYRCQCRATTATLFALEQGCLTVLWQLFQASLKDLRMQIQHGHGLESEEIQRKRKELLTLYRQNLISLSELEEQLRELALLEKLRREEVSKVELKRAIEVIAKSEDEFVNAFKSMPLSLQRHLVLSVVKRVEISDRTIVKVEPTFELVDFNFVPVKLPQRKQKYSREQFLSVIDELRRSGKRFGHRTLARLVGCSPFAAWVWMRKLRSEGLI